MTESSKKSKRSKRKSDEIDKETRKKLRTERRQERAKWLEQVPKTDEHGIPYTKQQLRRMAKRVSKGLNPIESKQEAHQRKVNESQLKRELETDLAGDVSEKDDSDDEVPVEGGEDDVVDDDDDEVPMEGGDSDEEVLEEEEEEEEEFHDSNHHPDNTASTDKSQSAKVEAKVEPNYQTFQRKRQKPVPDDYVCSACQNKIAPSHWIYDCPNKKSKGIHDPSAAKVFLSGLPFEANYKYVADFFSKHGSLKVKHVKLLTFADSNRCKGQAFVTFENEGAAQKALQLNGTTLEASMDKKKVDASKKKSLTLKVSKVLNRSVTKHQQQHV